MVSYFVCFLEVCFRLEMSAFLVLHVIRFHIVFKSIIQRLVMLVTLCYELILLSCRLFCVPVECLCFNDMPTSLLTGAILQQGDMVKLIKML
jgi:hypothetical protein